MLDLREGAAARRIHGNFAKMQALGALSENPEYFRVFGPKARNISGFLVFCPRALSKKLEYFQFFGQGHKPVPFAKETADFAGRGGIP